MRAIRIVLQIITVLGSGIFLAALLSKPKPDPVSIVVFLGFTAFLLALTLYLKEKTKARLFPDQKTSAIPFAVILVLLGLFGIFFGVKLLIGAEPLPAGHSRCRMICGLTLLAVQLFGESTGRIVAGGLWSFLGTSLCLLGFRIKNARPV